MKRVIYRRGKRTIHKKINKKKILGLIFLLILIIVIIVIYFSKESKSNTENIANTSNIEETNEINDTNTVSEEIEDKNIVDVEIPNQVGGYNVLGQLVIEKIGVTQNILAKTNNKSLNLGVTKFYGPEIDEPGNFCISGHNYTNILKRLNEMNVGDQFYIIVKETKERVDYQIYNKYTCEPTDLSCLDQNQDGKKEVTLITCNPGGLTRLICKAKEV